MRSFYLILLLFFIGVTATAQVSFTSVTSGDWEDGATWGNTSPGTAGTDYPDNNGDDNVTIASGHTVTLQSASTINNFTINSGGIFDYNSNTLTANGTVTPFISVQTGTFNTNSTWLNGSAPSSSDRVIVIKGHTVTTSGNTETVSDITVDAGAVLATPNNKDIEITSNITVNGTVILNQGNADLRITSASTTISGSGTIDGSESSQGAIQIEANATVSSGSSLTVINDIDISNNVTLTINGGLIVTSGDITGGNASSQVTMGTDSELEIDGALLSTGTLSATATGSTIEYNGSLAQSVKEASSNTYNNLTISGTSIKTLPATGLTVNGNLSVNGGTLDVNNQTITIQGNWSNSATISNLALVAFTGSSGDQSITSNATNFSSLTVSKSSGGLILNEDVTITSTLTMTQGNIDTGSNSLTLGSGTEGTFAYTAGRIIGTFGQYIGATTTTQFDYPIGTSSNDRTVAITFGQTGGGRSAGVVFASFIESDPGSSGFPVSDDITIYNALNEGYWDLSVNGFSKGNSNTFSLSLTGDGFSSFAIDASTRMLQRDDTGTAWAADGTHGSVATNTVSRTAITTFPSQFCFGDEENCTAPTDPTISGDTDVCTSDTNDTYSVTLNSGNDYNWTVVGGTIDEAMGATTTGFTTDLNSITVDWGSTGQVGSVSMIERNGCTSSNEITVDVNINSIAPESISGNTLVAENSTGVAYSVTSDANTTYTWSVSGGTQASGGTTNSITVDWGTNGTGTIGVTATKTSPSCPVSDETQLSVTKYVVVDSNLGGGSGNWNSAGTWLTGSVPLASESARISSGETVTLAGGGGDDINNLIVEGILDINSRTLTVSGDLTITSTGTITGTSGSIILDGTLTSPQNQIDGTGNIEGAWTLEVTNASKTISSSAVINQSGTGTVFNIDAGLTVTNEGSIEVGGNITGDAATSTWTNSTNSTLTIGGDLLTTGVLDASASGNTVIYNSTTAANIKVPSSNYHNIEIHDGVKTLAGTIDVNGNLTLTSGTFAMGTNSTTVAGNLTYTAGTLTTTGTITLDGSSNQTVSGAWSIPNLTINNTLDGSDAITLSSGITVSTLLTLTDGIVGSGSNVLTVSNTATGALSGGSTDSFINGILARQTNTTSLYDFPVGEGTTYRRAGITPTATGGSTYQVEPFNSAFSDVTNLNTGTLNNVSTIEYWDIQRTAGTDAAQIRLYWNTRSGSGISSVTELLVGHYTGGQWESQGSGGNSGDVDPGYVESATAVTAFSPFTFASNSGGDNPLPVELLHFSGSIKNGEAILEWATATEIDNHGFEIEKSIDGINFDYIGFIRGAGNTNELQEYNFTDNKFNHEAFYRLKQIDYDGDFEYSPVIYILNPDAAKNISIFPNPLTSNSQLELGGISIQNISFSVFDMAGNRMNFNSNWESEIEFIHALNTLHNGVYLINLAFGDNSKVIKVVK
ncbi:MAG: T9SS type A sorting domain-containing protein [bacterium]|nr:T9SS type A sorting domain-containing protein [bacterium]